MNPIDRTTSTGLRWLALAVLLTAACQTQSAVPGAAQVQSASPSPFPYVAPESLGLSPTRLHALVDTMEHWVSGGEVVGAELVHHSRCTTRLPCSAMTIHDDLG